LCSLLPLLLILRRCYQINKHKLFTNEQ
jgi:hypothetical protein